MQGGERHGIVSCLTWWKERYRTPREGDPLLRTHNWGGHTARLTLQTYATQALPCQKKNQFEQGSNLQLWSEDYRIFPRLTRSLPKIFKFTEAIRWSFGHSQSRPESDSCQRVDINICSCDWRFLRSNILISVSLCKLAVLTLEL